MRLLRAKAGDRMPALALVAAIILTVVAIGVFALARNALAPKPAPGGGLSVPLSTPSTVPTPNQESTLLPAPTSVAGVLMTPPGPIPLPTGVDVSAPSSNVAWTRDDVAWVLVASQYLYRVTTIGSQSTEQRPMAPSTNGFPRPEISFISDREGWLATGGSPETQCNGEMTAIWRTADAGATWQLLGASGVAYAQCKGPLSFVDRAHGFIGASDPNHAPVIYATADGGRTWRASSPLSDPLAAATQSGGIAMHAGRVRAFGSTLLVPVFGDQSGVPVQYVFVSTDGGSTWAKMATARTGGGSLALVTASRWIQLALVQSYETTDAGATWHPFETDYSQAAPFAPDVTFADDHVGYASVRGETRITTDGGAHWAPWSGPP